MRIAHGFVMIIKIGYDLDKIIICDHPKDHNRSVFYPSIYTKQA